MPTERQKEAYQLLCKARDYYEDAREANSNATCAEVANTARELGIAEVQYRRMMPQAMALLDELMEADHE